MDSKEQQIVLIGAGAMGEALIAGMVQRGGVAPATITAAEPRAARRDDLVQRYGIRTTDDSRGAAQQADILLLAVKPQMLPQVAPALRGALQPAALCLSILAGTPLAALREATYHPRIVRAMPNTPAQIGAGMTVWTATPEVDDATRNTARAILAATGSELFVTSEAMLDMATAINGSGPAYVFLFIEAMIDAGVHLGFARDVAQTLVLQTMLGAVRYAQETGTHPALLRNQVTSPGGTTAAALDALLHGGMAAAVSDAVWAAYRRSRELGESE